MKRLIDVVVCLAYLFMQVSCHGHSKGANAVYIHPAISMPTGFVAGRPDELTNMSGEILINQIYEPLFYYNSEFEIVPVLIENIELAKNKKEYILLLKKGVLFHNGVELTSEDVVYSIQYISKLYAHNNEFLNLKDSSSLLETCGKYCVRLKFSDLMPNMAKIFASTHYKIVPNNSIKEGNLPPGTGPFMIDSWKDHTINLKKYDGYHGKTRGNIGRCVFTSLSKNEAIDAYKNGQADDLFEYILNNDEIASLNGKRIEMPMTIFSYIGLNVRMKPFADPVIREAIQYAIDTKMLYEKYYSNHLPINGVIPRGVLGGTQRDRQILYNMDYAKALISKGKGEHVSAVEFWIRDKDWQEDFVNDIKKMLSDIGLELKVMRVNNDEFYKKYFARTQQMFLISLGADYKDGESIISSFRSNSADNDVGIKDDKLDEKISNISGINDKRERAGEIQLAEDLILGYNAILPLYQWVAKTVYSDSVSNVALTSSWQEDIRIYDYTKEF